MKHLYKFFSGTLRRRWSALCMGLTVAAALLPSSSNAQSSAYTFAQSTGTYTPITGGTTLGIPTNDDDNFNVIPLGFYFFYNGVPYNTVSINNNGLVYFNNAATNSYGAISGTTTNVIAGLNYDLQGNVNTGNLRYRTIGTAPNRTFVVQWTSYRAYLTSNGDNLNFQIRLNETSNTIDVVYGTMVANNLRLAQVGIRSTTATDFNNREVINGITTWATSTAGTLNTATCEVSSTLVPASGQTYTWTPAAGPVVPNNLTFTGVTYNGMTLNWNDNSTDEVNFYVFNSTDNINFNLVSPVASTSTATTGTPYSYAATGLSASTLYYWRVYASNTVHTSVPPLSGSQSTSPGTLCGTITIGPTGTYTSITAAVAAVQANGLSCPVIFELQPAYVSTVETFPINLTNLGTTVTNTITIRPMLGATNLSVTSTAAQTVIFNGTSYVSFDGRPGGTGTVSHLTLENTSTTGIAAQFVNGTQYCGMNYMKIRGANTSATGGAIQFGNATATTGNSNNSFTNCDFTSAATPCAVLVYNGNTSTVIRNENNVFTNNVFYNWFTTAAVTTSAFNITGASAGWNISNNSFYQTATRTFLGSSLHYAVLIASSASTLGGGFTVSNNFIGGTAANCGGTAWTDAGAVAHRFAAISISTGTYGVNEVQGNTIRNFNFTTTSGTTTTLGIWCGIAVQGTGASYNVGNTTPNVIGSNTTNNQIVTSTSSSGGMTAGIYSSGSAMINISTNQIGGITANSSLPTISSSINGINVASGFPTINGNVIGSTNTTNSLITAANNSATGGQITGIISTTASGAVIITNNTVANLTNQYAGTSTAGFVRGIVSTSGMNTITGNTVASLATVSPMTGTTTAASAIGIQMTSASTTYLANQVCANNTVGGIVNGGLAGNTQVNGIIVSSSTTTGYLYEVYRNNVQAIGAPATAGISQTNGIHIIGGAGRIYNNFVILGLDPLGAPVTQNQEYNGINKNTANRSTITFNSVSIDGAGVAIGTNNTYAYRRLQNPTVTPADSVMSNIFSNTRSNGAGTGFHYAAGLNNTTNFIANGNDYYVSGPQLGIVNAVQQANLPTWIATTVQDANSFSVNPNFQGATNLHINNATQTALESRAVAMNINTDYDNQVRPGPTAVNGGGTGPDIGADEFDGIPVNVDGGIQLLVAPATSGCHSATDSIVVRFKNYATATLDFSVNPFTITGTVTGPNPIAIGPFTISSGTLAAGATRDYNVVPVYNMTAVGTYVFNVTCSAVNDFITSNNGMSQVSINISGGATTVTPGVICLGSQTALNLAGQTNGGTIQWQSSPDNITWTNIASATSNPYNDTPGDTTFYRAVVCGQHNSTVDTVQTIYVAPPTVTAGTRCGPGSVTVSATGTGNINWYAAATGGTALASGNSYSPNIANTTTFYAENQFQSCGASTTPVPATCLPTYTSACSSADIINNVFTTGGLTNISNLNSGCNGTLPSNTTFFPQVVTCPAGSSFVFNCQSGASWSQGFRIWIDYNNDGDFADAGEDVLNFASSTALNTGTITVPASTAPGPKRIRVMCRFATVPTSTNYCINSASFGETEEYVLNVCTICNSTRVPVTATITPPPVMTTTAGNIQLCGSDSTLVTIASAANYQYTWSPATYLSTTTGDTVQFTPLLPGNYTYYIDAIDTTTGCTNRDTISLGLGLNPTFTLAASDDTICAGSPTTLNVVLPSSTIQVTNSNVTNTSTTYPAPYGQFYGGSRHQMLILASELAAVNMTAGYYAGLTFQVTNGNAADSLDNFTISIGTTTAPDLSTGFVSVPMTTVYTNAHYLPNVGTNVHQFSTPFFYDGVSNILIETCFANYTTFPNTTFTTNASMRQTTTPFVSTAWNRYDNTANICTIAHQFTASQRPNMGFLRSTASWTYNWSPIASLATPTNDTTVANPTATTMYYMTVTDTLTGCSKSDSILIVTNPLPAVSFGNDTLICSGDTLMLQAPVGGYAYLWHDSTTADFYNVVAAGTYHTMVTDTMTGCMKSDTINIGVNQSPTFTLGSDVVVCQGTSVTFSGPAGGYSYLWDVGAVTQNVVVDSMHVYMLTVTDTATACFGMDTVMLTVNPNPPATLGNDTSICSVNAPYILNGPSGGFTYMWQDSTVASSYTVGSTGNYSLTTTDTTTGCFTVDTVAIQINPTPVVALGNDTTLCDGPLVLNGPAGGYNYLWSDSTTLSSNSVITTGMYSVTVTDSLTGCAAADSINVTINLSPVVDLGADSSQCGGDVTLDAGAGPFTYLWQDNTTTTQTYSTLTSGLFSVTVTDTTSGCTSADSVNITIYNVPVVTFSFTDDTVCTQDAPLALTGTPAGGTFSGPGVTGSTFSGSALAAGTYGVTYTYMDVNGCMNTAVDSVIVSGCVGVNEISLATGLNLFPNPNNGQFTLTIRDANFKEMSIQVYSIEGKVIYSDMTSDVKGNYSRNIDLSNVANGTYYLKVIADGQMTVKKVFKQD